MAAEEVNKPFSHPPYAEMILAAIAGLNDENGSSKSAISKYIEGAFNGLPSDHSVQLTNSLNQMKESGELVYSKNNFMLKDPNAPPKRGRGRPPKPKLQSSLSDAPAGPPRPRGRPPKAKDPLAPPSASPRPKVASGSGKPRGRPPKKAKIDGGVLGAAETEVAAVTGASRPRGRGRPPKVKPQISATVEGVM
ncbi:hypothetical protein Syun_022036 [Stephania yunnanensis]|uniref:H15 domain-containing protein n=1 Tax=Stephania yunnanensis TaxID=152371 RepID=A0AAP0NR79_9MAGN